MNVHPLHLTMFGLNPVVKFGNEQLKETFLPAPPPATCTLPSG